MRHPQVRFVNHVLSVKNQIEIERTCGAGV
jgi:hypothetical protein